MGTQYLHVTVADRMSIQALLQATLSGPAIARKLKFTGSTIHREINRSKVKPMALAATDQGGVAQARSQANRRAGVAEHALGRTAVLATARSHIATDAGFLSVPDISLHQRSLGFGG